MSKFSKDALKPSDGKEGKLCYGAPKSPRSS
jgi:hypothetical protein